MHQSRTPSASSAGNATSRLSGLHAPILTVRNYHLLGAIGVGHSEESRVGGSPVGTTWTLEQLLSPPAPIPNTLEDITFMDADRWPHEPFARGYRGEAMLPLIRDLFENIFHGIQESPQYIPIFQDHLALFLQFYLHAHGIRNIRDVRLHEGHQYHVHTFLMDPGNRELRTWWAHSHHNNMYTMLQYDMNGNIRWIDSQHAWSPPQIRHSLQEAIHARSWRHLRNHRYDLFPSL